MKTHSWRLSSHISRWECLWIIRRECSVNLFTNDLVVTFANWWGSVSGTVLILGVNIENKDCKPVDLAAARLWVLIEPVDTADFMTSPCGLVFPQTIVGALSKHVCLLFSYYLSSLTTPMLATDGLAIHSHSDFQENSGFYASIEIFLAPSSGMKPQA